ncbi:MAG: PhoH family protein, partial [Bacilli bacterium]|nr:PhoH family protein [Bacilli bacterium]
MELNIELIQIGKLNNSSHERSILGPNNRYLNLLVDLIGYDILLIEGKIEIDKRASEDAKDVLMKFLSVVEDLLDNNLTLGEREMINIFESVKSGNLDTLKDVYLKKELVTTLSNGKPIYAKTINQINYLKALETNDIVFAVGPAGTGKTFLGVCFASKLLKTGACKKIVLVRPVVEAGEKLGFLPGDLKEKIDPYLVPLYDCLDDCFGKEHTAKLMEKGAIEVCPLAYMRGRTLDNSVIILDEAQNATQSQMKMFLTRLGF